MTCINTHTHTHTLPTAHVDVVVSVCRLWEMMRISSVRSCTDGAWLCSLWLHCNSLFHYGWPCIAQTPKAHTESVDPLSLLRRGILVWKYRKKRCFCWIIVSTLSYQIVMNWKYIFFGLLTLPHHCSSYCVLYGYVYGVFFKGSLHPF